MSKYLKFLRRVNIKSIVFNLKYLPFRQAIKFPFLISGKVYLLNTKGSIKINAPLQTGMIQIGYGDVGIFDKKRSRSVWNVTGEVVFEGEARIGHGSKISVEENGVLEIGERFNITAESSIVVQKNVRFGKDCLISWDCLIMDTDFHKIYDKKGGNIINTPQPVLIGENVWIGCRNLILKGAKIADNSVIGANSTLSKDISDQQGLFVGNPAKMIKEGIHWEM